MIGCIGSVYRILESIRFGRIKEGELLSALIYGGGMPPHMKSKIENTIAHYTVLDQISEWSSKGLLNGVAGWLPACGSDTESLVGWNINNQNVKFSRVNHFFDKPRRAKNRVVSGKENDQLDFSELLGEELSAFPPEIQMLHTREWDAEERVSRFQVWGVALKSNGELVGDIRQKFYDGPINSFQNSDAIEESLMDFSIKENGMFDLALEKVRQEQA